MLVLFSSIMEQSVWKLGEITLLRSLLGAELHFEVHLAKDRQTEWVFKQQRRVFLEKQSVLEG